MLLKGSQAVKEIQLIIKIGIVQIKVLRGLKNIHNQVRLLIKVNLHRVMECKKCIKTCVHLIVIQIHLLTINLLIILLRHIDLIPFQDLMSLPAEHRLIHGRTMKNVCKDRMKSSDNKNRQQLQRQHIECMLNRK